MKDFIIHVIQELPIIDFENDLSISDLCPVTERANSVLFILDDDTWEEKNGVHTFKIKFKKAPNIELKIRELKDNGKIKFTDNHISNLANICKVYRISTTDISQKEKLEETHYLKTLQEISKAIDEFNLTTITMGVSND
jgi:hypothetical protein